MEFYCARCGGHFWTGAELADHMESCPATQDRAIPRTPAGTLDIPALLGFKSVAECVREGTCRQCGTDIDKFGFRDEDSAKEYSMSGLCQHCQDEVFAPSPEDEYSQGEMP